MKAIFVVCQHGDEITPLKVILKHFAGKVDYLLANQEAFSKKVRFLETDLNRSFPGSKSGTKEEKLASHLLSKLKKYDATIDFHTTSSDSPIFVITTSLSTKYLELINSLSVEKVVYMENSIASGKALIDHVPLGISLEVGPEGSFKTFAVIKKVIEDYLHNKKATTQEFYSVFDVLKKDYEDETLDKSVQSFKLVKKGDRLSSKGNKKRLNLVDFYPIMPREKSYTGVLTLMARKIRIN